MSARWFQRLLSAGLVGLALGVELATAGCKDCREDESEEQEEKEQQADHFWRAQIAITGKGRVKTVVPAFDCVSEGMAASGECGPKLVKFKEMRPPLMEALPSPGWRLDHWESHIRDPDGSVRPRAGPMPDGRFYLNGFGYADTGQAETVTAVFVPAASDAAPDGG